MIFLRHRAKVSKVRISVIGACRGECLLYEYDPCGRCIANVTAIFPDVWEVSDIVPEKVRNYLGQAHKSLVSPDASVLMSAASIDAMLKEHELKNGSLYDRIDEAVAKGILTQKMADWANKVRLDANNPRHADD